MKGNNNISDDLLIRYLQLEITNTERLLVEHWLQNEVHKKHFEQVKMIWELTHVVPPVENDVNTAWLNMKSKAQQKQYSGNSFIVPKYVLHAAAVLLLLVGGYITNQYFFDKINDPGTTTTRITSDSQAEQPAIKSLQETKSLYTVTQPTPNKLHQPGKKTNRIADASGKATSQPGTLHSKEEICNNTHCPLEICILQSLECAGKASTFAYCKVLQPDESGLLHYKTFNDDAAMCNAPVKEIRITRTTTGETITLNNTSEVTAQEFFDYITQDKTGNLTAGIFEADCNNHCVDQRIKIDNTLGMPTIVQ